MTKSRGILAPRRFWTEAEIALLCDMYPDCAAEDVAAFMGRTAKQVYCAAKAHGLRKSPEFLASDTAARIQRGRTDQRFTSTQFKPGQQSWSKGLRGVVGVQEGCRATQFKKGGMTGAAQHNYKPIGSERINADGYLDRKVTDDASIAPARRWVGVHRLVWEAVHGPVPAGHVVVFKPGRHTTERDAITEHMVELVTRAELMRRNSYHTNYPPEVRHLIQLRGALNRQINKHARATEAP